MPRPRVNVAPLILRAFHALFEDVMSGRGGEWWMKGGRGSTKSSFISLCIILIMVTFPFANGVVVRRYANTLRSSVYEQLCWAISALGLDDWFICHASPMEIVYRPTGQKLLFRGLDDPLKAKGVKFRRGYCAIVWFEELDQIEGWEVVRSALKSFRRGGGVFWTFYSYNPPRTLWNWVNRQAEAMAAKPGCTVHHSTYLDVLADGHADWLGQDFIEDAEWQRETSERAWRWEMLGEVVGTGAEVFDDVEFREITDDEIDAFDNMRRGQDFGWYPDPWAFTMSDWQPARRTLLTWYEDGGNKLQPWRQAERIKGALTWSDDGRSPAYVHHFPVLSDDAEPQTIAAQRDEGVNAKASGKGGMRDASYRFLQTVHWVIDPRRCPKLAEEVRSMEYERGPDGEVTSAIPDGNDHYIDSARYATMREARARRGWRKATGAAA